MWLTLNTENHLSSFSSSNVTLISIIPWVVSIVIFDSNTVPFPVGSCGDVSYRAELEAQLQLFSMVELVWSLCQILLLEASGNTGHLSQNVYKLIIHIL